MTDRKSPYNNDTSSQNPSWQPSTSPGDHTVGTNPSPAASRVQLVTHSRGRNHVDVQSLETQFVQLCQVGLRLEEHTQLDAFRIFGETKNLLTSSIGALGLVSEEEMATWWKVCILYCALRMNRCSRERGTRELTLSQLLTKMNLSIWDFFRELPQFLLKADSVLRSIYGDDYDTFQQQAKAVQSNFVHLTVLFNYYKRNFFDYFLPSGNFQRPRPIPSACDGMNCSHLRFGWMLFLALRVDGSDHFIDLVTCTNGLIAVLVIMIIHMPSYLRKFSLEDSTTFAVRGPRGVNILGSLCYLYEASENDVLKMVNKANCLISQMIQPACDEKMDDHVHQTTGMDTDGLVYFRGLMEEETMASYLQVLDNQYEQSYQKQGEVDERLFLPNQSLPSDMISDSLTVSDETPSHSCAKRKHEMILSAMNGSRSCALGSESPPLVDSMSQKMLPTTPVSMTMTTAKWLRTVIVPLHAEPSADLISYLMSCGTDITREVTYRAQVLLEALFSRDEIRVSAVGQVRGDWASERRIETLKLYYKVLGAICKVESELLQSSDLSALLKNERFHRCLLACSAELVLATYRAPSMDFVAVLEPLGITAFDLSRVIESFVRNEETLPRELKRHLNSIEERLLENLAWEQGSSMYNALVVAKPQLRSEIHQLGLLADTMPSLEEIKRQNNLSSGSLSLLPPSGYKSDVDNSPLSPSRQVTTLAARELGVVDHTHMAAFPVETIILPPTTEGSLALSNLYPGEVPPLQATFASPKRSSVAGGGETCAETVISIFFQKVLKLAANRIKGLCESLKQSNQLMEEVYKMFHCVLQNETHLFFNRHIDQIILCTIYIICKVKQLTLTFKEIVQHYKRNPQHKPQVFRAVFLNFPSTSLPGRARETGDIIQFYNDVFVPATKGLLMQLNACPGSCSGIADQGGQPSFPSLPDMSPKKVSASHNVYVSPLRSSKILSPHSRCFYACIGESTQAYQSPSKDLTEINKWVNTRKLGRLEFGSAGLVSDSLVVGTLYPQNPS